MCNDNKDIILYSILKYCKEWMKQFDLAQCDLLILRRTAVTVIGDRACISQCVSEEAAAQHSFGSDATIIVVRRRNRLKDRR